MVYAYHVFFIVPTKLTGFIPLMLFKISRPGWLGVDLFFVLSGFLITGILIDSKEFSTAKYFKLFYARRALRILPLYYLSLSVISIVLFLTNSKFSTGFVTLSFVYLSNVAMLLGYSVAPSLGIFWSLAIEEQFYLVWPIIVRHLKKSFLFISLAALLILEPILRAFAVSNLGLNDASVNVSTWLHLDGLLCGSLLAILIRGPLMSKKRVSILASVLLAASIVIFVGAIPYGAFDGNCAVGSAVRYFCAALFFSGILCFALLCRSKISQLKIVGIIIAYFGKRSYCIYLIHVFIIQSFDKILFVFGQKTTMLPNNSLFSLFIRLFFITALIVLVSEASYRWYESKWLALKKRFEYA